MLRIFSCVKIIPRRHICSNQIKSEASYNSSAVFVVHLSSSSSSLFINCLASQQFTEISKDALRFRYKYLKVILESPLILKITDDSLQLSAYLSQASILIWNVYDVQLAHQMILLQRKGIIPNSKDTHMSLRELCKVYSLENPNNLESELRTEPNKHKLISESLNSLYRKTKELMDSEFKSLFDSLSENNILKSVDSVLVSERENQLKNDFEKILHVKDIRKNKLNKGDLQSFISREFENQKAVCVSSIHDSALLRLESRSGALHIQEALAIVYPNLRVSLCKPFQSWEKDKIIKAKESYLTRLESQSYITNPKVIRQIVEVFLKTSVPLIFDVVHLDGRNSEFPDVYKAHKMGLLVSTVGSRLLRLRLDSSTIIQGRIGALFSSSNVVKVVSNIKHGPVRYFLSQLGQYQIRPSCLFDVIYGVSAWDYLFHGSPIEMDFDQNQSRYDYYLQNLRRFNEFTKENRFKRDLIITLHLLQKLPNSIQKLVFERNEIAAQTESLLQYASCKYKRISFKNTTTTCTLHIKMTNFIDKKELMDKYLHQFPLRNLIIHQNIALITFERHLDLLSAKEQLKYDGWSVEQIQNKKIESKITIDQIQINSMWKMYKNRLDKANFNSLLQNVNLSM